MRRELAAGADVNALDEDGVTPLLYPATFGDQDTVRELLKAGANPNQPGQSISPLTGAASWGDTEMVKLLLDAGATVPDKLSEPSPLLNPSLNPARLHPAIAAGMVTGPLEAWRRRPTVADCEAVRDDADTLKGWYGNPFLRVLLVFFLSNLGAAIGAWIGLGALARLVAG